MSLWRLGGNQKNRNLIFVHDLVFIDHCRSNEIQVAVACETICLSIKLSFESVASCLCEPLARWRVEINKSVLMTLTPLVSLFAFTLEAGVVKSLEDIDVL